MQDWTSQQSAYNPPGQKLGADEVALGKAATQSLGAFDLLGDSWNLVKDKLLETVGGLLLAFGVAGGVQMALSIGMYVFLMGGMVGGIALGEANSGIGAAVMFGGMAIAYLAMIIAMIVTQTLAMAAYQLFLLRVVRGQSTSFSDLKAIKPVIVPLLGSTILTFFAAFAGSMLLVIPGIILTLGFAMTTYVILDKNLGAVEAMKASWRIMSGHKLQFFVLGLALSLLNIVGMMACGLGTLLTMPMGMVAIAMFYNRIAEAGNAYIELAARG